MLKISETNYNEENILVVEYDGEHHYTNTNFTDITYVQFLDQNRRDTLKGKLCNMICIFNIIKYIN